MAAYIVVQVLECDDHFRDVELRQLQRASLVLHARSRLRFLVLAIVAIKTSDSFC